MLTKGAQVSRQNKEYYVVAGTAPINVDLGVLNIDSEKLLNFFKEPNDGVVAVKSAQHVGNKYINNKCNNYFELGLSHGELLDHQLARKLLAKLVDRPVASAATLGYNKYIAVTVNECDPKYTYVAVGDKISDSAVSSPSMCNCGNDVCGVDEDEFSCPSDCAVIERTQTNALPIIIYALLLGLVVSILAQEVRRRFYNKGFSKWLFVLQFLFALLSFSALGLQHFLFRPLVPAYILVLCVFIYLLIRLFPHKKPGHVLMSDDELNQKVLAIAKEVEENCRNNSFWEKKSIVEKKVVSRRSLFGSLRRTFDSRVVIKHPVEHVIQLEKVVTPKHVETTDKPIKELSHLKRSFSSSYLDRISPVPVIKHVAKKQVKSSVVHYHDSSVFGRIKGAFSSSYADYVHPFVPAKSVHKKKVVVKKKEKHYNERLLELKKLFGGTK